MKTSRLQALIIVTAALSCSVSKAATIQFDLQGTGGFGLLNTNEPGSPAGGTGGEIGTGITFDNVSNILTLNFGWGTANGFTNLTGNATAGHIHGPTVSANGAGFTQSAGVKYGLDSLGGWNASASAGGLSGPNNTVNILAGDVAGLLNGQFYVNVHTATNGGGEARGFLVQAAPEPTSLGLMAVGALGLLARRKRHAA